MSLIIYYIALIGIVYILGYFLQQIISNIEKTRFIDGYKEGANLSIQLLKLVKEGKRKR